MFNLRSNRSGAVAVVTIKWVCPSPQSSAVHCSHCCLRRPPPARISRLASLRALCQTRCCCQQASPPYHRSVFPLIAARRPPPSPHTHTPAFRFPSDKRDCLLAITTCDCLRFPFHRAPSAQSDTQEPGPRSPLAVINLTLHGFKVPVRRLVLLIYCSSALRNPPSDSTYCTSFSI